MNSLSALESIFVAALDKRSAEDRAAYLDEACGHDPELRRHMERLLNAQARAGSFLQDRVPGPAGTIDQQPREQPGTIIGPYKLLQQIGEGGMGVVYMAEQQEPIRRKVALKIIKPGMDSTQVIARFEAERQALALMDHQNIARVLDAGTTESGRPFFVMELVHGVPITRYCDENKLTPRQRLELFVPVCQAVQHAHQKGVIHRDLKPSNVLVTLYDGKPVPKVIDFGVAKATEQRLTERTLFTQYGTIVGTFEYMAPEQAEMSALGVDTRSDIYSLGVLLYELLTGTTPLDRKRLHAAALEEMLRLIREEEPPRPSARISTSGEALATISQQRSTEAGKLAKLVRGEIDWIVMRCLEKDRTRRYETASGLARDVEHYLKDEPVEACPPSTGYKLRKFVRKRKAILATAAAFAGLLLAGAAASTWQAVRATRAESAATQERDAALAAEEQARADQDRAVAAEAKAKTEKENAQATLDFLWQDVLARASPFNEPDRDLKVRTLLDRIADRLEKGSGKPALVEAAIRRMVGELYTDLGESQALRHLEWARDVQLRELGEKDPHSLATMHSLGVYHFKQNQIRNACEVLGRALELRRSVLGEEHPDTLVTMRYLGTCTRDEEGLRLLRQALALQSRVLGEKDRETLSTMLYLAENLARQGKFDEAESLSARCLDLSRRVFGDADFLTVLAMLQQARTYGFKDDMARAEPLLEEALKCVRRIADDHHPATLGCMYGLAAAYQWQGKHADAAKLIAQLLDEPRTDSDGHVRNISAVLNLRGRELITEKQYAEAEQTLRECLAIFAKSESIAKRANFVRANFLLGASLLGQKKYAEAEPFLLKGFEVIVSSYQEDVQKRPEDPLLTSPLGRRLQIEAMDWLVQLYDEWDKPDEAAKWRKKLEETKTAANPTAKP
jgi:serine/threonine protein kinase